MRRVINTSPTLDRNVENTIKTKGYRDFQHFATIALENQVAWEADGAEDDKVIGKITREMEVVDNGGQIKAALLSNTAAFTNVLGIPNSSESEPAVTPEQSSPGIMGLQQYRFFPNKIATRVLANVCKTGRLPQIKQFTEAATEAAVQLRLTLAKLDKASNRPFGEQLVAGTPEKSDKSRKRFAAQLIYVSSSTMRIAGMLPQLKFVNIQKDADGSIRVGLTKHGWDFAMLRNPILDAHEPRAFSQEEVRFLLSHIADNLTEEAEHMTIALRAIEGGNGSREYLNSVLRQYYQEHHDGMLPWTDAVVNTMRAGVVSRMLELGLLQRKKNGKNVTYSVTEDGRRFIEGARYA